MINLTGAESYNRYLEIFAESPFFSSAEKHTFCSVNVEKFLFEGESMHNLVREVEKLVAAGDGGESN